jgi:hypothetical protein
MVARTGHLRWIGWKQLSAWIGLWSRVETGPLRLLAEIYKPRADCATTQRFEWDCMAVAAGTYCRISGIKRITGSNRGRTSCSRDVSGTALF